MTTTKKNIRKIVATAAALGAMFCAGNVIAGELTVEENMAKEAKKHIIPGKKLTAKGPNYEFCEVAPIMGTTKENAVANFYNPTGLDHCSPEDFEKIVAMKEQIIKETGAMDVFLNPSRHWAWDEFFVNEVGEEQMFGDVKFVWMAVVPFEPMTKAVGKSSYHPTQIQRKSGFIYKKGTEVYLIDIPESDGGGVMVMQSWTSHVNKGETADNLKDLGSLFKKLPEGWKFRTKVLDRDLTVEPQAPKHLAWVTMDEFMNTYEVCGRDEACTYVP